MTLKAGSPKAIHPLKPTIFAHVQTWTRANRGTLVYTTHTDKDVDSQGVLVIIDCCSALLRGNGVVHKSEILRSP